MSLRGHTAAVAEHLKKEIQDRLARAGVEVMEARISHLAYAPEIAQAMLQRQQAGAIIAARQRIVEGAVGMVRDGARHAVAARHRQLDNERKAAMVSNLLVVLCGDGPRSRSSTPARSISRRDAVADRKPFLLRIDRERPRRRSALGRRRPAQPERPDRVPAAAGVERGGAGAEKVRARDESGANAEARWQRCRALTRSTILRTLLRSAGRRRVDGRSASR